MIHIGIDPGKDEENTTVYPISPMGKPRMTQRDKWKKRPVVVRYMEFKDQCFLHKVFIPQFGARVTFVCAMPKSWSKRMKAEMIGLPHTSKPDLDNCLKALMDAVFTDDSVVWDIRATKIWGESGKIIVEI